MLGQHDGVHHYTIGQRKGLGIAAPEPLYVIELDAARNRVVVGDRAKAANSECYVDRVNWVSVAPPAAPVRARAQIRYRSQPVSATIVPGNTSETGENARNTRVKLIFDEPQLSITPGQAAVWYDGEVLLGGGIIEKPAV